MYLLSCLKKTEIHFECSKSLARLECKVLLAPAATKGQQYFAARSAATEQVIVHFHFCSFFILPICVGEGVAGDW